MFIAIIGILIIGIVSSLIYGWQGSYYEDPYICIGLILSTLWITSVAVAEEELIKTIMIFTGIIGTVIGIMIAIALAMLFCQAIAEIGDKLRQKIKGR